MNIYWFGWRTAWAFNASVVWLVCSVPLLLVASTMLSISEEGLQSEISGSD